MKPLTAEDLEQLFLLAHDMLSIIRSDGTFKRVNPGGRKPWDGRPKS